MKKLLFILCSAVLLSFLMTSCKPKVDVAKEKEAIMTVINGETQSAMDLNIEKMKGYYVQDEFQTRLNVGCGAYQIRSGWDKVGAMADSFPSLVAGMKNIKFSKEFLNIKVMGDVAWAVYKESSSYEVNNVTTNGVAIQTMVLEKKDGVWKISLLCLHDITPPPPPPPPPPVKPKK